MHFTEPFIRRPILAISLSLVLFFFGLRSLGLMPITEYPPTNSSMITVTTHYFGATPKTVNARRHGRVQLGHHLLNPLGHVQGITAGSLLDADIDRRLAVHHDG